MKTISNSGGGAGFHLLEYHDKIFLDNRQPISKHELLNLLNGADNYLIEEYTVQSDFENKLFPYTVNTLRIVTLLTEEGVEVAYAIQRMGANTNACADNASLGGFFSYVDIKTGKLSALHTYDPNILFDKKGERHNDFPKHPLTGFMIQGQVIPNFQFIIEEACRIHKNILFTGAEFVAWDFALTNDGYRVIEGNTSCGMKFLQFCEGQRNKKLGEWMRANKYMK